MYIGLCCCYGTCEQHLNINHGLKDRGEISKKTKNTVTEKQEEQKATRKEKVPL